MAEPEAKKAKGESCLTLPTKPTLIAKQSGQARFREDLEKWLPSLELESSDLSKVVQVASASHDFLESLLRKLHTGSISLDNLDLKAISNDSKINEVILAGSRRKSGCWLHLDVVKRAFVTLVAVCEIVGFMQLGRLLGLRDLRAVTALPVTVEGDKIYLQGTLRFCKEIELYALGRAIALDIHSVAVTKDMVEQVFAAFIQFDLKNGNLRRNFDGLKYIVRNLENKLYTLSTVRSLAGITKVGDKGDKERVGLSEFVGMKERMEKTNDKREEVIKLSRKIQKLSKSAIFAVHRLDTVAAEKLLIEVVKELKAAAELRADEGVELGSYTGAFTDALEEYAEAQLFLAWRKDEVLLGFSRLNGEATELSMKVYIGGLVDFTGELGRYGVQCATGGAIDEVAKALDTMLVVEQEILGVMPVLWHKPSSKLKQLTTNINKLKELLFEQNVLRNRTA